MELTKKILEDIIKGFAEEGRIFSKEAQFQFELAIALRDYVDKNGKKLIQDNNKDRIQLEHLSQDNKMYTDIVVRSGGSYYPIELKYKTADKQIEYIKGKITKVTYCQGAHDDASYDFLKDIERLEKIVIDKEFTPFDGEDSFKIEKGFAIIISNEPKFWGSGVRDISHSPWHDFFLFSNDISHHNCERTIKAGTRLGWTNKDWTNKDSWKWINDEGTKGQEHKNNERFDPICLKHKYNLKWEEYMDSNGFSTLFPGGFEEKKEGKARKAHPFKFMIVEVKN